MGVAIQKSLYTNGIKTEARLKGAVQANVDPYEYSINIIRNKSTPSSIGQILCIFRDDIIFDHFIHRSLISQCF